MREFFHLLRYLRAYKVLVGLNILCNILMALFTVVSIPAIIPFFQILFDRTPPLLEPQEFSFSNVEPFLQYQFSLLLNTYEKEQALVIVCVSIVGIFFLKNFFRYGSAFFMAIIRNNMVRDIRSELFDSYLQLPLSLLSTEKKGDLVSRITIDVQEVEASILRVLETVFREPIVMAGSVAFMLLISPTLTLFIFGLILFTVLIIGGVSRTLKKESRKAQDILANLVSIIDESLSGMRIVRAFNAQELTGKRFSHVNENHRHVSTRILWRRDLASPLSEVLGIAVVAVLLWFGSRQVFSQQIAAETFFAFLFAFFNVIAPAKSFSSAYYFVLKGLAAVDRIDEVRKIKNPVADKPDARGISEFRESIEISNVTFRYPGSEIDVLKDIDLTIKKGQIIALVGSSGSGKSTLADLVARFHDVTSGSIKIDGVDIRDYKIFDLRELMGIVSQDPILFNDTIRNNIEYSLERKSDEAIQRAAKYANAHDFIMETEQQYETVIGERGTKLSGGQRQRLTIARALLENPPILILDEATAALDSESEKLVQEALEHVMEGRTTLIIAHRLSTIRHADVIYVLKDGRIVEAGSHDELQSIGGEYKKFVALQAFN